MREEKYTSLWAVLQSENRYSDLEDAGFRLDCEDVDPQSHSGGVFAPRANRALWPKSTRRAAIRKGGTGLTKVNSEPKGCTDPAFQWTINASANGGAGGHTKETAPTVYRRANPEDRHSCIVAGLKDRSEASVLRVRRTMKFAQTLGNNTVCVAFFGWGPAIAYAANGTPESFTFFSPNGAEVFVDLQFPRQKSHR